MCRRSWLVCLWVVVLVSNVKVDCAIFVYDDWITPWNSNWSRERFALWTTEDSPAGSGPTYVQFNYTFSSSMESNAAGSVEVLFFPSRKKYVADFALNFLTKKQECPALTTIPGLSIPPDDVLTYRHYSYPNPKGPLFGVFDEKFEIQESAVWYLYIFHCQENPTSKNIRVGGLSEWKNPYGHLDGQDYLLYIFSMVLFVSYGFSTLLWVVVIFLRRKNLLTLQYFPGLLLLLGLLEAGFMLKSLDQFNQSGLESLTALPKNLLNLLPELPNTQHAVSVLVWELLRVVVGSLKQMITRLVILVLMLGYSTARVNISKPTIVFLVGTCLGYGISGIAYCLVKIAPSLRDLSPLTTEIVQFPGIMFNLVCFGWFFVAAYNTMQYLREHKQLWKVNLYHYFSIVLGVCLLLGLVATISKGTAILLQWNDIWWKAWWMWEAFWYSLFYVCLVVSTVLWRPLPDNTVYHLTDEMRNSQQINTTPALVPQNTLVQEDQDDQNPPPVESSSDSDTVWEEDEVPLEDARVPREDSSLEQDERFFHNSEDSENAILV